MVELEPGDMNLVWSGLFGEIMESVASECTLQLNRLLSMLLSTMHNEYVMKMSGKILSHYLFLFSFSEIRVILTNISYHVASSGA